MFTRYAIYFLTANDLADAGAAWLGWDSTKGCEVPRPRLSGLDMETLTQAPRKYGFHATIKPPFVLADGTSQADLQAGLAALCATLEPVALPGLEFAALGRFLALVPTGDQTALNRLAAAVVTALDRFRAPLTQAELARRGAGRLGPAQERNLRDWGYPHVHDQFRFHITLTGRLPKTRHPDVIAVLRDHFGPHLPAPFRVDALTLAGEGADGRFRQIKRFGLTG